IEDMASAVAVISFAGGIILYLFKKIVTDPLRGSIDALNKTIDSFKKDSSDRMDRVEKRVDILEDHVTRHEERIKTLYKERGR
ncbi:MAG: hypothetical protein ACE3JK_03270, partial [Sporolactobacillus sp.]